MKKIFILSLSLVTLLISCKKNDDSPVTPTASILPKKLINDSTGETFLFTYDGNKLKEYSGGSYKAVYKYTGNLITAIYEYEDSKLEDSTNFTYENDRLKSDIYYYTYIRNNQPFTEVSKNVYTHNADGTITVQHFRTDYTTGVLTLQPNRGTVLTYANGNMVKSESNSTYTTLDNNGNSSTISTKYTNVFEHDSKNSPFKNVTGFNKLIDEDNSFFSNINNVLKTTNTSRTIPDQGFNTTDVDTNTYQYNSNNYPVMIQYYYNGKLEETTRIEY
jgi:hypothetical protein